MRSCSRGTLLLWRRGDFEYDRYTSMQTSKSLSITLALLFFFGLPVFINASSHLTPNTKVRINLDPTSSLNVRRTPGGEKLGVQQGQSTGCVEETQGDWAKINYDQKEDGLPAQAGWSASRYLTAIGTCDNQPTTPTSRIKVNPHTTDLHQWFSGLRFAFFDSSIGKPQP